MATTGTFPFFSTPVTCHHAEMIVRDLAAGKMVSSSKVTDFMGEGSDGRASNTRSNRESMMRRNSAGDRRQTFLHQARFSAYMKHSERNRVTQKNRMSIATMLNYYPEKEEPDGEFGWIHGFLGNVSISTYIEDLSHQCVLHNPLKRWGLTRLLPYS